MTLDEFVTFLKQEIEEFEQDYLAKHKENPEQYPLDIEDDGLWFESFMTFDNDSLE